MELLRRWLRLRGRLMANALFVCLHNAGRSQMSQALFEREAAGRHGARSAGTTPGKRVHPEVVEAMREVGVDLADRVPRELSEEDARWADVVVTMGCGDKCPYIPGRRYVDWDLPDPNGRPIEEVRATRDEIERRVRELVAQLDRGPGGLYDRQAATLVASWRAYARHSAGARVDEVEGAAVCLFPAAPERGVYNNALLPRGLDAERARRVVAAVQAAYRDAAIPAFAIWAHESESAAVAALEDVGLGLDTSTRAMAMSLDALSAPRPEVDLGDLDWEGYVSRFVGMPGLLSGASPAEFHLRVGRLDGRDAGAVIPYDHAGDGGVFNLTTLPEARRRGVGTALTALALHEARERGCTTASLQSTPMAEGLYAALGFADLGRYLEYVPTRG